jgi:hypothetical protein
MFSRWGAFVYRFRRPVAVIAVVIAVASTVLASQASSVLSAGGWLDANSESAASRLASTPSSERQELDHRPLPVRTLMPTRLPAFQGRSRRRRTVCPASRR